MLYMLMICYDPTKPAKPEEQNLQPEHARLEAELRQAGTFVSGAGLWPVEGAKSVRTQDGQTLVTDGVFAETKEAVGGYYIVECEEAEAVAIAGRIPVESRSYVQVRPIALFHPNVARIPDVEGYIDPRIPRSSIKQAE
jgi:hypothetical protein